MFYLRPFDGERKENGSRRQYSYESVFAIVRFSSRRRAFFRVVKFRQTAARPTAALPAPPPRSRSKRESRSLGPAIGGRSSPFQRDVSAATDFFRLDFGGSRLRTELGAPKRAVTTFFFSSNNDPRARDPPDCRLPPTRRNSRRLRRRFELRDMLKLMML